MRRIAMVGALCVAGAAAVAGCGSGEEPLPGRSVASAAVTVAPVPTTLEVPPPPPDDIRPLVILWRSGPYAVFRGRRGAQVCTVSQSRIGRATACYSEREFRGRGGGLVVTRDLEDRRVAVLVLPEGVTDVRATLGARRVSVPAGEALVIEDLPDGVGILEVSASYGRRTIRVPPAS